MKGILQNLVSDLEEHKANLLSDLHITEMEGENTESGREEVRVFTDDVTFVFTNTDDDDLIMIEGPCLAEGEVEEISVDDAISCLCEYFQNTSEDESETEEDDES